MITIARAREIVEAAISERPQWLPADDELIILDGCTIEKPWGWVFFHTSKKWHETHDIRYAIAGNAPFIVEKAKGKLMITGTAFPIEHYIESYERAGNPNG